MHTLPQETMPCHVPESFYRRTAQAHRHPPLLYQKEPLLRSKRVEAKELVNVRFMNDHAAEIARLAKEYGFPKAMVARLAVEHGMNPGLGSLEEHLAALRIEQYQAKAEEKSAGQNAEVPPASGGVDSLLSTVLSDLQNRMTELSMQWAAFLEKQAEATNMTIGGHANGGPAAGSPADGSAENLEEKATDSLPLPLESIPSVEVPVLSDEDFMDEDAPATKEDIDALREMISGLREYLNDLDSLVPHAEPAIDPVMMADMRDRLLQIWERVNNPGSASVDAPDSENVVTLVSASMEDLRNALNSLVDAMATQLPEMISEAVAQKMSSTAATGGDLPSSLEVRLERIESLLGDLADSHLAGGHSPAPASVVDLQPLESRLDRLRDNMQTLFAEVQRMAPHANDDSAERIAAVEEKVDRAMELLHTLIEESGKPFSLEPSKGFGKKFVGSLRVVKED